MIAHQELRAFAQVLELICKRHNLKFACLQSEHDLEPSPRYALAPYLYLTQVAEALACGHIVPTAEGRSLFTQVRLPPLRLLLHPQVRNPPNLFPDPGSTARLENHPVRARPQSRCGPDRPPGNPCLGHRCGNANRNRRIRLHPAGSISPISDQKPRAARLSGHVLRRHSHWYRPALSAGRPKNRRGGTSPKPDPNLPPLVLL